MTRDSNPGSRSSRRGTRRCTAAEVRATYGPAKAFDELVGDWPSNLIYRPPSFLVTPWFINAGIRANTVSVANVLLALGVVGIPLVIDEGAFLAVAAVIFAILVLDCVDGNIARTTGEASLVGHYTDGVGRYVYVGSVYLAIGLLSATGSGPLADQAMFLAGIAVALALCARLSRMLSEALLPDPAGPNSGAAEPRSLRTLPPADLAFVFVSGLENLLPFLILAAGLAEAMHWLLGWVVLYSALDFLHAQHWSVGRMRGGPRG